MADAQPGDRVLYSPHACHQLDRDARGERCFHFAHAADVHGRAKKGDPADLSASGGLTREPGGALRTGGGHEVEPAGPVAHWDATVTAVREDGTADLDVSHPNGCVTLHYPRVPYDGDRGAHTWHRAEGE